MAVDEPYAKIMHPKRPKHNQETTYFHNVQKGRCWKENHWHPTTELFGSSYAVFSLFFLRAPPASCITHSHQGIVVAGPRRQFFLVVVALPLRFVALYKEIIVVGRSFN